MDTSHQHGQNGPGQAEGPDGPDAAYGPTSSQPGAETSVVLSRQAFTSAVAALPLVAVDWVVTNPSGEMLLGRRLNAPAVGWWFTPGGRIRKNEALAEALQRVGRDELGLPAEACVRLLTQARLMGAWDHFYPDSAFSTSTPTHYVNLPHWLDLSWGDLALLALPVGAQHSAWQWIPVAEAALHAEVHPYARVSADWVVRRHAVAAPQAIRS